MSSYRFCRSDDVPLLVEAHDRCWLPHFPDTPRLNVDELKRATRETQIWTSSCMVAFSGKDPIAVLLAGKRDDENLIWRVAAHPAHLRQGHCLHLLTSLSAKLHILGPRRMVAEVPAELDVAVAFMKACGYETRQRCTDYRLARRPPATGPTELVEPITVEELVSCEALDPGAERSWERQHPTLWKRRNRLRGLAVASESRIEAFVLYDPPAAATGVCDIVVLHSADRARSGAWFALLLIALCTDAPNEVTFRRVLDAEHSEESLRSLGFEPTRRRLRMHAEAAPS